MKKIKKATFPLQAHTGIYIGTYHSGACTCLGFFFKTSILNISHSLTVRELFHRDFSTCIDISSVSYLSGGFSSSKNRDRSSRRWGWDFSTGSRDSFSARSSSREPGLHRVRIFMIFW